MRVMYYLYKLGETVMNILPLKVCYRLASWIGDIKYFFSVKDKKILTDNLKVVLGDDNRIPEYVRGVFRNFCKYLVDFIRQGRMDKAYLDKHVKIKGAENLKNAFAKNNGVILMSAHLGNWELGAVVTRSLGFPLNVIALPHKDKKVDNFFNKKRMNNGVGVIPLGGSVKKAFKCLDRNEAIAILADRDFSQSDLTVKFFGRDTIMPRGIGIFRLRKNVEIVPCLMVREPDDSYSMTFDKPIEYEPVGREEEDMKGLVRKAAEIIEGYVKKYPDQWFMFERLWESDK